MPGDEPLPQRDPQDVGGGAGGAQEHGGDADGGDGGDEDGHEQQDAAGQIGGDQCPDLPGPPGGPVGQQRSRHGSGGQRRHEEAVLAGGEPHPGLLPDDPQDEDREIGRVREVEHA
ncbi:hypothetical protein GCM10010156_57530 [Planobispora rosea]|uniref:Uncharacterized protein n=1 Tax=Planobispora rosea TaxID=35762 RepID=A0A8J3S211_PLARO|nr:hypothetical protein GCM10010156_57530 [Planobispora rosea]GIH87056.1 hypothetical protein Pro02_54640 [Planobispora rosea]